MLARRPACTCNGLTAMCALHKHRCPRLRISRLFAYGFVRAERTRGCPNRPRGSIGDGECPWQPWGGESEIAPVLLCCSTLQHHVVWGYPAKYRVAVKVVARWPRRADASHIKLCVASFVGAEKTHGMAIAKGFMGNPAISSFDIF